MVLGGNQAGKGAKGLSLGKGADGDKKDKKKPVSRSSKAGLQVGVPSSCFISLSFTCPVQPPGCVIVRSVRHTCMSRCLLLVCLHLVSCTPRSLGCPDLPLCRTYARIGSPLATSDSQAEPAPGGT